MQRRRRAPLATLLAALSITTAFAGCSLDDPPRAGPVSLLVAYRATLDEMAGTAGNPHLIGFVGHEGRPPAYLAELAGNPYLSELIGPQVAQVDTTGDDERGDGRALVWTLLFATDEGTLLRSTVTADPLAVEVDPVEDVRDAQLAALWSLNLGGRLLVDSIEATRLARAAHPEFDARLARGDRLTYTSDLVPVGAGGERDLVHALFLDGGGQGLLVAHVRHYTGELLGVGPYEARRETQRVVVVDESFTLNPAAREGSVERDLPVALSDARITLETVGTGRYTFTLFQGDETLWVSDGVRAADNGTARGALGSLAPGTYGVNASALGNVWFHLRVDGVIGL